MTKIIIIALLSIFLQCSSQKNQNMIPKADSKFERFDIAKFKKNEVRGYFKYKEDANIYIQDTQSPGYRETLFIQNSFFKYNKFFSDNGNIEKKGILFINGSSIGIWYFFDETGKLIKEENTDEDYHFSPEDVVEYCEKHKIKLPIGYQDSGFQTIVDKREENGKKVWMISHQISADEIEKLILDGKTGKELSKKIVPFINN
ncbi:hypothetical protein FNJ88_09480 [Chryseobacterium sp. SNU WT5]|uniref:hypothetical protein n=1 Tax=Chryseobacterium sp. SNU WT5 TaxID=2594269 RepID=UPI00117D6475|nr:hypothetical protein [Chryseobacterium sp. SNU WT5]QDP85765.1 hypothetical protein FNJ88_09480 [Chryseobacterium sp. SNU WT5]